MLKDIYKLCPLNLMFVGHLQIMSPESYVIGHLQIMSLESYVIGHLQIRQLIVFLFIAII
jgi:hypothetical protein